MSAVDSTQADAVRALQRQVYSLGDYSWLARRLEPAATALVQRAGVASGDRVLDVAAGDGNVAVAAARRGATVTAVDLAPEQIALGAERCADEGLDVGWLEGDAEALPCAPGSFDHALSCFGAIYAPSAPAAVAELVRVCVPGGRVGVVSWPADGFNERIKDVLAPYLPESGLPLPEGAWGTEEQLGELLETGCTDVTVERAAFAMCFPTMREFWAGLSTKVPIQRLLAEMIGPEAYEAMGRDLVRMAHDFNRAVDGTVAIEMEFLLGIGRAPAQEA